MSKTMSLTMKDVKDIADLKEEILKDREIDVDADEFFNPTMNPLEDVFPLNSNKAVEWYIDAVKNGKNIAISYDIDADGVTSGVLMTRLNRMHGITDDVMLHGQRSWGHGIASQIRGGKKNPTLKQAKDMLKDIQKEIKERDADEGKEFGNEIKENLGYKTFSKATKEELPKVVSCIEIGERRLGKVLVDNNKEALKNCDLLIIVDSSSNETEYIKKNISSRGIKTIILDHHMIDKPVVEDDNCIIVNPMQEEDDYPNKSLSGAGVVYKFIKALERHEDYPSIRKTIHNFSDECFDIVSTGIIADVMSVDGMENRYIINQGLKMDNIKNAGIKRMLRSGKEDLLYLSTKSIAFSVAPLINAVARVDRIELAIKALLTDDDEEVKAILRDMRKANNYRKDIQESIFTDEKDNIYEDDRFVHLIYKGAKWGGFTGVIAQTLLSHYGKPAFVGSISSDGKARGSYRSPNEVNMYTKLRKVKHLSFGHEQAGGFESRTANWKQMFEDLREVLDDADDASVVYYDYDINADDVSMFAEEIEHINKIVGNNGFPTVKFNVYDIPIIEADIIGKTRETCKVETGCDDFNLIKFKTTESEAEKFGMFDSKEAVGEITINRFKNFMTGETTVTNQLIYESVRDYE